MGPRRYILSKAETRFFLETKKDEETHRAATHVTPPTSTCSDRSHRLRFFRSRPPRTSREVVVSGPPAGSRAIRRFDPRRDASRPVRCFPPRPRPSLRRPQGGSSPTGTKTARFVGTDAPRSFAPRVATTCTWRLTSPTWGITFTCGPDATIAMVEKVRAGVEIGDILFSCSAVELTGSDTPVVVGNSEGTDTHRRRIDDFRCLEQPFDVQMAAFNSTAIVDAGVQAQDRPRDVPGRQPRREIARRDARR